MQLRIINNGWFAIVVPGLVGYVAVLFCVYLLETYGLALFLGLPVVVSFLSAFCHGLGVQRTFMQSLGVALASLLVLGALVLTTAIDGLICLVMAAPLAIFLGLFGAVLGHSAGDALTRRLTRAVPLALLLLFPFLVAFETLNPPGAPLRSVTTSIPIRASASTVWDVVVAFPRIQSAPDGIFRYGIACPLEARIEGSGVGAIRYCTFSTGSFVEPITAWKPGELLAFDVTSSPLPMTEFSLYEHVDPPHLHGQMQSRRGQFRIRTTADGVILEGTTWYEHRMWPQWYWGGITDGIIHRIHHRVLDHIRVTAESAPRR
jgi:hypothetical protein